MDAVAEASAESFPASGPPAWTPVDGARAEPHAIHAHGHSRLREAILGGTPNDVLRDMTRPVLMSY